MNNPLVVRLDRFVQRCGLATDIDLADYIRPYTRTELEVIEAVREYRALQAKAKGQYGAGRFLVETDAVIAATKNAALKRRLDSTAQADKQDRLNRLKAMAQKGAAASEHHRLAMLDREAVKGMLGLRHIPVGY